ncbi:MAG: hypothetical protein HY289_04210, partial [Planctomycetes bacterium]|nr:hypothetical protein [Planctomycetota bacterium]
MMVLVECDVHPGIGNIDASVVVRDTANVRTFLQIDRDFPTNRKGQSYLPVGLIYRDKEKGVALIELAVEADSGTHRLWVPVSSLLETNGTIK